MEDQTRKSTVADAAKVGSRAIGTIAILFSVGWYSINAIIHRDYHPIRLYRAEQASIAADRQRTQASLDQQRREEEQYDKLVKLLFGEHGLADRNNDRFYSFEELVDAYRRMGARFDRTYS